MLSPPQLLISVRDAAEARAALAGGADVVDVKDPSRGSLGRADDAILDAVRHVVLGKRLVSAALGELRDLDGASPRGFDFVKCGLAALADDATWRQRWLRFHESTAGARAVVVAYADWQCAAAPPLDDVIAFACERPEPLVLIDTCCKDKAVNGRRATLLDWLPLPWLAAAVDRVHAANGRIALAGSLRLEDIQAIRELQPDWIAVRGAACVGHDRGAAIDLDLVRQIKSLLHGEN